EAERSVVPVVVAELGRDDEVDCRGPARELLGGEVAPRQPMPFARDDIDAEDGLSRKLWDAGAAGQLQLVASSRKEKRARSVENAVSAPAADRNRTVPVAPRGPSRPQAAEQPPSSELIGRLRG